MMLTHSITNNLRAAVSELEPVDGIRALLDAASSLTDVDGAEEDHASRQFAFLGQLIGLALICAEQITV